MSDERQSDGINAIESESAKVAGSAQKPTTLPSRLISYFRMFVAILLALAFFAFAIRVEYRGFEDDVSKFGIVWAIVIAMSILLAVIAFIRISNSKRD